MKERAVFGIEAVQLLRCTAHMSVVLRNKGPGNFRCCRGGQNERTTGWCKRTNVLVGLQKGLRRCGVCKTYTPAPELRAACAEVLARNCASRNIREAR
jgi:hypothetical protein